MKFKILADENLAYTDYFFADFGEICYQAGRKMTPQDVKEQDILLVRSVTQVNADLLSQSQVQFVGSATIGTDHLNISDLEQRQITWANASGCNAQAVAEYVITALYQLDADCLDKSLTLGIVGLGNVGSRLAKLAHHLGWNVKAYDPFKAVYQGMDFVQKVDFQDILQCDVISIHTPFTKTGDYPTYHLFNQATFQAMRKDTILINSARGAVVEQKALLDDIQQTGRSVVLDVFEHEPNISEEILQKVKIVTPHIAGYSLEGKARGTEMIYQAFCQHFQLDRDKSMEQLLPENVQLFDQHQDFKTQLKHHIQQMYPILRDDTALRQCLKQGMISADDFDQLRKNYPLRREWSAYGFIF